MVSRLEDLAPPRVSRSTKLEVVKSRRGVDTPAGPSTEEAALREMNLALRGIAEELSELSRRTRSIAREEAELSGARLINEARSVARQEALATQRTAVETGPPKWSWAMILVVLCASAAVGLAATFAGWPGVVLVAMLLLIGSTVSAART